MVIYVIITSYLLISLVIAVNRIFEVRSYEKSTWDVPEGDLYLYGEKPELYDTLTTVFFPAKIIIKIVEEIVRLINNVMI